ncbi:MAG: exodeoxyribonuclease VII small subunit [Desulfobacula sp. RIFOXYB2_FULL_45_6]|nr:MAG: exodeoxyribonuclease VII small subunit [Desulfobacula sp. RIFOXYB2_FULL_45_6]
MVKKQSFESSLKELEEIVKEMESGNLTLEEAVKKYEAGIKQTKFCNDFLNKTEKKIIMLAKDNEGNLKEEIFEND